MEWITKTRTGNTRNLPDVSVRHKYGTTFIIREDLAEKISDTGFVAIGHEDEKVYFKPMSEEEGYKLCVYNSNRSIQIRQSLNIADGPYELQYDFAKKMYYIASA